MCEEWKAERSHALGVNHLFFAKGFNCIAKDAGLHNPQLGCNCWVDYLEYSFGFQKGNVHTLDI
jgi:hypothetical protein